MLCAKCISIFQNVNKTREGDHHKTVDDLIKAAQSGCRICIYENMRREHHGTEEDHAITEIPLLRYRFQPRKIKDGNYWEILFISAASWAGNGLPNPVYGYWNTIDVHVHVGGVATAPHGYRHMLKSVKEDLAEKPWHVRRGDFSRREIPSNTGDDASIKVAESWLRACIDNHKSCGTVYGATSSGWYPERLVALREDDSKIRLVIPTEDHVTGDYAALSHCWGRDSPFLTLNSENYERFRKNISITTLPSSFRDGISACRRLHIKYLWIDSLCILQSGHGSDKDWLHHATEMGLIYMNCALNLTIVHASSPGDGAFAERNPDFLQDCYLWSPLSYPNPADESLGGEFLNGDLSDDECSKATSTKAWAGPQKRLASGWQWLLSQINYLWKRLTPEELHMCVIFMSSMDSRASRLSQPLTSRGWVLQERLLAPRALHFQQDRIAWECQEAALSEYFPSGIPCGCDFDSYFRPAFNLSLQLKDTQRQSTKPVLKKEPATEAYQSHEWSNHYWDVVDEYSTRDLSFPAKDKLVAFSAVAKQFGPAFEDEYFVGMFRQGMLESLLWKGCRTRRQEQWRAPSWSWASVDGRVLQSLVRSMIQREMVEALANVEDVQVELVDPSNRYGQVRSGKLVMRGMVLPWRKERSEGENDNSGKNARGSAAEDASEQAENQAQMCGSGNDLVQLSGEDRQQALDSGSETLPHQESKQKLFKAVMEDNTDGILGDHQEFHGRLSITCDGGTIEEKSKLDSCFLLPIFERIPRTEMGQASPKFIRTERSWGLVLLRQDDGFYTRLGVYDCEDRCLGREASEEGVEPQIITIL